MVFLVHVAQRHRVGKELVEILHALFAHALSKSNRQLDEVPEGLDLVRVLMSQRLGSVQDGVGIDHVFGHERSPLPFERMTSDP